MKTKTKNPYPGSSPDKVCVHGNKWGGQCQHCDGENKPKPASAHTPGPWLTFGDTITAADKLAPGYTLQICAVGSLNDNVRHERTELEANKKLIAAAPETAAERDRLREVNADLLKTLQRLTEKVERANALQHSGGSVHPDDWAELYQIANESRAALSKAGAK